MAAHVGSTLVNFMALTWVMDLEKKGCSCTDDWRRKFLKYWYILALVWPLVMYMGKPPAVFTKMLGFLGIVAFFALSTSLWSIQTHNCRCAQDWREKVLLVLTVLSVIGIFFLALK